MKRVTHYLKLSKGKIAIQRQMHQEEWQKVYLRYLAGETVDSLASEYDVTPRHLRRILFRGRGGPVEPKPKKPKPKKRPRARIHLKCICCGKGRTIKWQPMPPHIEFCEKCEAPCRVTRVLWAQRS